MQVKVDTGFTVIHKFHKNSELPKKKSKKSRITNEYQESDLLNEHAIGFVIFMA